MEMGLREFMFVNYSFGLVNWLVKISIDLLR